MTGDRGAPHCGLDSRPPFALSRDPLMKPSGQTISSALGLALVVVVVVALNRAPRGF
jgi:hypothetical protein